MRVIAFDTALDACSLAIWDGDKTLWRAQEVIGRGHSERLPPMTQQALAETGLAIKDFDRIGVVIGPGAFAGVRVGVAFARGLALGVKARAFGVTSLEAMAASAPPGARLIASVIDARRGQVYAGLYAPDFTQILPPFVASPDEAADRLLAAASSAALRAVGSGAPLVSAHLSGAEIIADLHVDPVALARRIAVARDEASPPSPLYLRPPDAAPAAASLFEGLARL